MHQAWYAFIIFSKVEEDFVEWRYRFNKPRGQKVVSRGEIRQVKASLWLVLFQWKTLPEEKTVIVEETDTLDQTKAWIRPNKKKTETI